MFKSARYEACIGYCMTRCKIVPGFKFTECQEITYQTIKWHKISQFSCRCSEDTTVFKEE